MKISYDLHIHSVLSSCADVLNSPNNILNMAMLKKLDVIAITDHNTLKHLPVLNQLVESYDMVLLYGVEVTVKEDFHVLCYFMDIDTSMLFDQFLENHIQKAKYDIDYYGEQIITDMMDLPERKIDYFLTNPIDCSVLEVIKKTKELNGLVYFAHIDKQKHSGIDYLAKYGDLIDGIELSKNHNYNQEQLKRLSKYNIIINSDAHIITEMLEDESYLEVNELSVQGVFDSLRGKNNE